jgi:hypothetical protein
MIEGLTSLLKRASGAAAIAQYWDGNMTPGIKRL